VFTALANEFDDSGFHGEFNPVERDEPDDVLIKEEGRELNIYHRKNN